MEKEIGERRIISVHGAGLSVAPEIAANCEKPEQVGCIGLRCVGLCHVMLYIWFREVGIWYLNSLTLKFDIDQIYPLKRS